MNGFLCMSAQVIWISFILYYVICLQPSCCQGANSYSISVCANEQVRRHSGLNGVGPHQPGWVRSVTFPSMLVISHTHLTAIDQDAALQYWGWAKCRRWTTQQGIIKYNLTQVNCFIQPITFQFNTLGDNVHCKNQEQRRHRFRKGGHNRAVTFRTSLKSSSKQHDSHFINDGSNSVKDNKEGYVLWWATFVFDSS